MNNGRSLTAMVAYFLPPDDEPLKTHTESKEPRIDIRYLADYMAASRQAQRGVVRDCKYRRTARVVQHREARAVCFNYLRNAASNPVELFKRAAEIRAKFAVDDFEADLNEHNAGYVEQFASKVPGITLPDAEIMPPRDLDSIIVNGVTLRFGPALLLRRTMKTNRQRSGAVMLRYTKGKALSAKTGEWQAAGIFGFLRAIQEAEGAEPELPLCVVIDAYSGKLYSAPSNSVYRFNEMKAACADIAERWPNIQPPPNAII